MISSDSCSNVELSVNVVYYKNTNKEAQLYKDTSQVKKNDFIMRNVNQIKNSTNHMLIITVLNNTPFLQLSVLELMSTSSS
jgi:hypothetical protein